MIDGKYIEDLDKDVLAVELFAKARGIKPGDVLKPQILGKTHSLKCKGYSSKSRIYLLNGRRANHVTRSREIWCLVCFQ